jgi:hypothetical protein
MRPDLARMLKRAALERGESVRSVVERAVECFLRDLRREEG